MKHWAGRVAAVVAIASVFLSTGCGTFFVYPGNLNGGGSSSGDYVYEANSSTSTMAGYAVGTATLTAVSGSPYSLGFVPTAMAINAADTILFVAGTSGGSGFIATYSIGSSGALSLLLSNNVGLADEVSLAVSPDGQWLLGLDATGVTTGIVTVDEYAINSSTGGLTLATGTSSSVNGAGTTSGPGIVNPTGITFAPNGQLVFVTLGTAGELVFTFNTASGSGLLTSSQSLFLANGSGFSDNALAISSSGNYLYVARSGPNGGLVPYSITGTGGTLTSQSGSPFAAGTQPFAVAANSTNVYVANRGSSSGTAISGYSVATSGTVASLASYAGGSSVTALALDKSGKYLLAAANGASPDLWMYSFDSSGNLVYSTSINATGPGAVALAATH